MHLWIRRREADGEDEASTGTKVEFDPSAISGCKLSQRAAGLPVLDILTTNFTYCSCEPQHSVTIFRSCSSRLILCGIRYRRHASASRHSLRPPTTPYAHQNSFATSSAGTVKHVAGVIWLWLEWDTKGKALEDSTGKVWLLDKVSSHISRLFLCRSFVALRHSGGLCVQPCLPRWHTVHRTGTSSRHFEGTAGSICILKILNYF